MFQQQLRSIFIGGTWVSLKTECSVRKASSRVPLLVRLGGPVWALLCFQC